MKTMNHNYMFFLLLELLVAIITTTGATNKYVGMGCIERERDALLELKKDLTDPSNRLASWNGGDVADPDCCKWSGVVCNNLTGHVLQLHLQNPFNLDPLNLDPFTTEYFILLTRTEKEAYLDAQDKSRIGGKINPSLLHLQHLSYLDLSFNDFAGTKIPKFLGSVNKLEYLNLSYSGFMGMIPHQLGNLSHLRYLDLSCGDYYLHVDNLSWLSGLSLLHHLDLGTTNLSKASDWSFSINSLPSLQVLILSFCTLSRFYPQTSVGNTSSLSILDLSHNVIDSSVLPWVSSLNNLVYLDLHSNAFEGPIPVGLQNLTLLRHLDLSSNNFNSTIPNWLSSFSHLEYLSLWSNNLRGSISSLLGNVTTTVQVLDLSFSGRDVDGKILRSFGRLCNLRRVDLSNLNMSQDISTVLDIFSSCVSDGLEFLDLSNCQIFGRLTNQIEQLKNLSILDLSGNSISGPIPSSLGELSSLEALHISDNKLQGPLEEIHFANLSKLKNLDISRNSFTLNMSLDWIPPFQLETFRAASCNHLGDKFPSWLLSQNALEVLDLSNSEIKDTIQRFLDFNYQIRYLDLSKNRFDGEFRSLFKATHLRYLDLSSNKLSGPLPLLSPKNLEFIDLSNNTFSGSIFHFCSHGLKNLRSLNLDDNLLSGNIPDCWKKFQYLKVLGLASNKFTGILPHSIGWLTSLESLRLHKNHVSGTIPESFKNCTKLLSLNIAENQISGNVPTWIGEKLSKIIILNFRSNKFDGQFPEELCLLNSLHILDLAQNNLFGSIPKCVNNFSAMVRVDNSISEISYDIPIKYDDDHTTTYLIMEKTLLVKKGRVDEYNNNLNLVRVIDLSVNNFSGEIPAEVTELVALQSLNLSHNHFNGKIPEKIGAMVKIESMDFSNNNLFGNIPQSIKSLTFLTKLNLSYNNLSGEIPKSTQLQSLDGSSFKGNSVCGPALLNSCSKSVRKPEEVAAEDDDDDDDEVNWFYVSMALGFVMGFWFVIGPLIVNPRWRYMYSLFLDDIGYRFITFVQRKCV